MQKKKTKNKNRVLWFAKSAGEVKRNKKNQKSTLDLDKKVKCHEWTIGTLENSPCPVAKTKE